MRRGQVVEVLAQAQQQLVVEGVEIVQGQLDHLAQLGLEVVGREQVIVEGLAQKGLMVAAGGEGEIVGGQVPGAGPAEGVVGEGGGAAASRGEEALQRLQTLVDPAEALVLGPVELGVDAPPDALPGRVGGGLDLCRRDGGANPATSP